MTAWYRRWEDQQQRYMPRREERFEAITDAIAALCGDAPHVVDLGCGPGSLAQRILEAIPGARVTAVDMDPVLLAIGRGALGDAGGRLRFVDSDLRDQWEAHMDLPVDAAASTTALHWLQGEALVDLYSRLAAAIRPGGCFLDGDRLSAGTANPQVAAGMRAVRARRDRRATASPTGEEWDEWWAAAARDPAFADAFVERERRHHDHPEHDHQVDLPFHRRALADAGFAEIDVFWQNLDDRVLVAIR